MAKTFYTQDEVLKKLGLLPEQLKDLVRSGKLREFRDGGKVSYKVAEVDKLALASAEEQVEQAGGLSGSLGALDMLGTGELTLEDSAGGGSMDLRLVDDEEDAQKTKPGLKMPTTRDASGTDALSLAADDALGAAGTKGGSGTGELVLEPAEEEGGSAIRLGTGDADAISLEDTTTSSEDDKEGTVVSSIGVSVFDDDEVAAADPLAKTTVSGGSRDSLGIDAVGSGSGLLDLTRESDDTSLGAELLDEIYPGEDAGASGSGLGEMGDATRAGLVEAIPEAGTPVGVAAVAAAEAPAGQRVVVTQTRVEYAPDAISTGLTGMLFVGVLVMVLAGLAAASAVQNVWPSILDTLADKILIVGGAALGAALIALGVGYFLGKKSGA
jgi:hypothetical protein